MAASQKREKSYYVHTAIVLFFMFGFGFIMPTFGLVTPLGIKVLGVFLGMLYGWIFIEMIWPSILGMIAFGLTGAISVTEAFTNGIGYNIVLQVLILMLFAELLNQCNLTTYIAEKCLSAKFIIGKPWLIIGTFFLADFLISALASNVAACFLLWASFIALAELVGIEKGSKEGAFVTSSILFISVLGAMLPPYRVAAVMFCGFLTAGTGLTVGYVPYFIFILIMSIAQIALLMMIGKYILKLDWSKLGGDDDRFAHMRGKKATYEQKVGLFFTLLLIVLLFTPTFLPKTLPLTAVLNNIGIIGSAGIVLVLGAVMVNSKGEKLADISSLCKKGIQWEVIWLLAATFPIANAMKSEECGIIATVAAVCKPFFSSLHPIAFMVICTVVLCLLTQVVHNAVLAIMFIPMLTGIAIELGVNPYVMFFLLYIGLQAAYVTPGASMQAAMMFGHDWVGKQGYFFAIIFVVISLLTAFVIGIPLGSILFKF